MDRIPEASNDLLASLAVLPAIYGDSVAHCISDSEECKPRGSVQNHDWRISGVRCRMVLGGPPMGVLAVSSMRQNIFLQIPVGKRIETKVCALWLEKMGRSGVNQRQFLVGEGLLLVRLVVLGEGGSRHRRPCRRAIRRLPGDREPRRENAPGFSGVQISSWIRI